MFFLTLLLLSWITFNELFIDIMQRFAQFFLQAPQNDVGRIAKGRFPQFLQASENDAWHIVKGFTQTLLNKPRNNFFILSSNVTTTHGMLFSIKKEEQECI